MQNFGSFGSQVQQLLCGPPGSFVTLAVLRGGTSHIIARMARAAPEKQAAGGGTSHAIPRAGSTEEARRADTAAMSAAYTQLTSKVKLSMQSTDRLYKSALYV